MQFAALLRSLGVKTCCSTVCCPALFKLQGGGLPTSGTEVDPTRSSLHPRGALHGRLEVLESLSLGCPVVLPQAVSASDLAIHTQNSYVDFHNPLCFLNQGRLEIRYGQTPHFLIFWLAPVCKRVQCGKIIGATWVNLVSN